MRVSTFRLSKVLDIPQGLSARLSVEKKKLLRMSQQRGMLENVSGSVRACGLKASYSPLCFSRRSSFWVRDGFLPFLVSFFDTFQKRYSTFLPVSLLFAGSYALENIEKWSDAETEEFAAILAEQDPDVYQYLTKKKEPEEGDKRKRPEGA